MTTINIPIAASADDAHENSAGTVDINDAFSIIIDATTEWIGLRFDNVSIPPGSTINSASFSCVPSTSGDEPNHPIYCEDVDDAAQFSASANNISGRARTTATVTWSSTDLGATGTSRHSSADISPPVQEVIDRGGWAENNALAVLIQGSSTGTRDLEIYFYDNGSFIPEFDCDYTAGGGADTRRFIIS